MFWVAGTDKGDHTLINIAQAQRIGIYDDAEGGFYVRAVFQGRNENLRKFTSRGDADVYLNQIGEQLRAWESNP